MASVTINQPGSGGKSSEMQMMSPPQGIVVPQGLPGSLSYLASLNEVVIHQHLDLLEVAIGWERNNKYKICNSNDQQFMYAKEDSNFAKDCSCARTKTAAIINELATDYNNYIVKRLKDTDCLTRQCCGNMRPFTINITDNMNQHIFQLHRPYRCVGSCLWCCCLQEMDIQSPPGISIGTVKQIWTCWSPKYQVSDAQGNPVFIINGECCYCACCTDIIFQVCDATNGAEVGRIIKHWGGCREIFGGVNDFRVQFPVEMDLQKKALLLTATFLIDFVYFERNNNNN